jgi:hypothetical protein
MPTVHGFVRCDAGSMWLAIIPKSKNRFLEWPPMKIVQPWALYGYGLAYYAVESSLDIPTGCARKLRWQTAGMFSETTMAEPWDGVGKAMMARAHKAQEGASGWVRCSNQQWNLSGYVTSYMKPLKSLVVIYWPHTKGSVNMSDQHGKMDMLVAWKQVIESLLMGNVYHLCRV